MRLPRPRWPAMEAASELMPSSRSPSEQIAVFPLRLEGSVAKELGEDDVGDVGEAHRRAGMSGVGLLDGVDGEEADRVDAELFELVFRSDFRLVRLLGRGDGGGILRDGIGHGALLLKRGGQAPRLSCVSAGSWTGEGACPPLETGGGLYSSASRPN